MESSSVVARKTSGFGDKTKGGYPAASSSSTTTQEIPSLQSLKSKTRMQQRWTFTPEILESLWEASMGSCSRFLTGGGNSRASLRSTRALFAQLLLAPVAALLEARTSF